MLLRFLMELHIQAGQLRHALGLHLFPAAPGLIGIDQLAELGAPVAQMVDADRLISQKAVNTGQTVAQHGGTQVADMEPLGDIDGRIVQADGLSAALLPGAVVFSGAQHGFQRFPGEIIPVKEKIQIAALLFGFAQVSGRNRARQIPGDLGRAHMQGAAQLKAGEGVIAHFFFRGDFQHSGDGVRVRQAIHSGIAGLNGLDNHIGKALFGIHSLFLLLFRDQGCSTVPMGSPSSTRRILVGGSSPNTRTCGT